MNRNSASSRLAAAAVAVTFTFVLFQAISGAFLGEKAEMMAKAHPAKPVIVASAK